MASIAFALACLYAVLGSSGAIFAPVLNTRNLGQLVGAQEVSEDGKPYYSFKGLRYAAPPIGPLRFKEPREGWPVPSNTFVNATALGPSCLQIARHPPTLSFKLMGSEDCLFLNVYTPSASQDQNRYPVLIYIHGGAFNQGKAEANPQRLVSRGIVVVTIQYRIGVFGFLSAGDRDLPGNYGLLDQQLALKWVQQNIHEFSGDSERVTLAGLSAGGAATTLHMVSPGSRGLFHQAIATSGVFLNPWVLHTGDPDKVRAVARSVGCPSWPDTPIAALLSCMRLADPIRLVKATQQFDGWRKNPFAIFGPVIDRNFVSEDPYKLLREGNVARMPLLLSCTTAEGNYVIAEFMENSTALAELDRNWMEIAPLLLDYERSAWTQEDRDFTSRTVRSQYLGNAPINNSTVPQLIQIEGDRHFRAGIVKFAKTLASARGSQPVYMYQFAYRGEFSASQRWSNSSVNRGPAHTDDFNRVSPRPNSLPPSRTQADRNMDRSLVEIYESFIKTGVPTTPNFPVWNPVPTTGDRLTFLNISSFENGALVTAPEIGFSSFWCRLPLMESGFTDC